MKPESPLRRALKPLLLSLPCLLSAPVMAESGTRTPGQLNAALHINANIVLDPCVTAVESRNMQVELGQWTTDYLADNPRTPSVPFTIHLTGCDVSTDALSVTFNGTSDGTLTDKLAIAAGSTAGGIAVGLENADGTPLAINAPSKPVSLSSSDISLRYSAYIIKTGAPVTTGNFEATATFTVNYE